MPSFDCQSCGACCCNSDENRAEGYPWYVELDDARSRLLRDDDLRKRYVVQDPQGVPHLRLDPSGRCAALRGKLGKSVTCAVYADRPRGCRRVMPGDAQCLKARVQRGIDPAN
ncbi:MAG: YkgJ family cysteine cluster protein [Deltaproteobacteria bacterium]|nr:YkgJ family cysteine cluster protein [Deltaproteobacteria bacterium]